MEKAAAGVIGPFVVIPRHSVRMDVLPDSDDATTWMDQKERPWDPPISDYHLPRKIFEQEISACIQKSLMKNTVIYSSPFRRCLQTAAVVTTVLGYENDGPPQVLVHPGVGEVMVKARQCCNHPVKNDKPDEYNSYLLSREEQERTAHLAIQNLLENDEKSRKSGFQALPIVQPVASAPIPAWDESYSQSMHRLEKTLRQLQQKYSTLGRNIVIVTHGDALQAAAQAFLGRTTSVYDLDFCACMVLDDELNLVYKHGLQMMELE